MSNKEAKYQDVLNDDFKQEGIKVVMNQDAIDMVSDFYFSRIIEVMREKPMTIKEITKKPNQRLKKEGEKKDLKEKDIIQTFRSEKSMYRYMKDLEKAGLTTIVGNRVVFGKTAVEKLYARTAKIFYMAPRTLEWWKTEHGKIVIEKTAKLLSLFYDAKEPDIQCLTNLIYRFAEYNENRLFKIYEEKPEQLTEIIYSSRGEDIDKAMDLLDVMVAFLKAPEYEKELRKCLGL